MSSVCQETRRTSLFLPTSRPILPVTEPGSRLSTLDNVRDGMQSMFRGRASMVVLPRSPNPEPPVSPKFEVGFGGTLPSWRLHLPYLQRTRSSSTRSSAASLASVVSRQPTPQAPPPASTIPTASLQEPASAVLSPRLREDSTTSGEAAATTSRAGVDLEEQQLADLASSGRSRRRRRSRRSKWQCGPLWQQQETRSKMVSSVISGLFLVIIITIYLVLALSGGHQNQEFRVLIVLVILITTVYFCHSMVRLCILILRPPMDDGHDGRRAPNMVLVSGGYANPPQPIRVALARDEEAAGIESEATKFPPPAYGLWRESVRVDPNRIFWQRNNAAASERPPPDGPGGPVQTARRPPSYISEDGVDYIIEAQGRSIAPSYDVPLPPHPSERRLDERGV